MLSNMENQQQGNPEQDKDPNENTTQPQPGLQDQETKKEKDRIEDPPHVETPKVPDADTEGIP
jgi:hypothetical protein